MSASNDSADRPTLEPTEEMIEAGVRALYGFAGALEIVASPETVVASVYRSMTSPVLDAVRREELREIDRLLIRLTGAAVVYGSISDPDAQRELLKCQSSILATVEALLAYIAELEAKQDNEDATYEGISRPEFAETVARYGKALKAAEGYLLNAKIDLETGAPKRTAIATIEGGLATVRATLLPKASVREEQG